MTLTRRHSLPRAAGLAPLALAMALGFAAEAARMLVDPENRYPSMVAHRTHPDIIWVQRLPKEAPKEGEDPDPDAELKRSIAIDQIRRPARPGGRSRWTPASVVVVAVVAVVAVVVVTASAFGHHKS